MFSWKITACLCLSERRPNDPELAKGREDKSNHPGYLSQAMPVSGSSLHALSSKQHLPSPMFRQIGPARTGWHCISPGRDVWKLAQYVSGGAHRAWRRRCRSGIYPRLSEAKSWVTNGTIHSALPQAYAQQSGAFNQEGVENASLDPILSQSP